MKYLYFWVALLASGALQVDRRTCDHAAPPPGMHYVCLPADSCNCHLEKDQPEGDQGGYGSSGSDTPCATNGLKYFVVPTYPVEAREAGKQGMVQAQILVGSSGLRSVKIESGDSLFAESVTETLSKWKFAPADSERIYALSVQFRLAGNPSGDRAAAVSGVSPLELVITAHPPLR